MKEELSIITYSVVWLINIQLSGMYSYVWLCSVSDTVSYIYISTLVHVHVIIESTVPDVSRQNLLSGLIAKPMPRDAGILHYLKVRCVLGEGHLL